MTYSICALISWLIHSDLFPLTYIIDSLFLPQIATQMVKRKPDVEYKPSTTDKHAKRMKLSPISNEVDIAPTVPKTPTPTSIADDPLYIGNLLPTPTPPPTEEELSTLVSEWTIRRTWERESAHFNAVIQRFIRTKQPVPMDINFAHPMAETHWKEKKRGVFTANIIELHNNAPRQITVQINGMKGQQDPVLEWTNNDCLCKTVLPRMNTFISLGAHNDNLDNAMERKRQHFYTVHQADTNMDYPLGSADRSNGPCGCEKHRPMLGVRGRYAPSIYMSVDISRILLFAALRDSITHSFATDDLLYLCIEFLVFV